MIKSVTSWVLLAVGGLIAAASMSTIGVYLYRWFKLRWLSPRGVIDLTHPSPSLAPDFVMFSIPFRTKSFVTTGWAALTAVLAAGVFLVAVGLHVRHLHRMDVGRARLKATGKDIAEPNSAANASQPIRPETNRTSSCD